MTDTGKGNRTEAPHAFICPTCNAENTATLHQVDETVVCVGCSAEIVVPRPRIRLSGRKAGSAARSVKATIAHQGQKPIELPVTARNAQIHSELAPALETAQESREVTKIEDETTSSSASEHAKPRDERKQPDPPIRQALDGGEFAKTRSFGRSRLLGMGLGAVLGLIGYFVVLSPVFSVDFLTNVFHVEPGPTNEQLQAQTELILLRWRSAERSRNAIDDDLTITLAEMRLNDMSEEVSVVQRAIEKYERYIEEDYRLSLDALIWLQKSFDSNPGKTEASISAVHERLRSDRAMDYLETLELVTQVLYANSDNEVELNKDFHRIWTENH